MTVSNMNILKIQTLTLETLGRMHFFFLTFESLIIPHCSMSIFVRLNDKVDHDVAFLKPGAQFTGGYGY